MNVAQLGDRGLTDVMAVAMCDSHVSGGVCAYGATMVCMSAMCVRAE